MHKLGRYILVTESDVSRAERFLEGRGAWAVSVGRMLPFVRAFTSIVAGLIRLPALKFGILSLIGTVIYATALASIGYGLGSAWNSVDKGLTVVGYILFALIVIAIVGFVLYRLRQFRREDQLRRSGTPAPAPGVLAPASPAPAFPPIPRPPPAPASPPVLPRPPAPASPAGPAGPSPDPAADRPAKPHSHRAS